MNITEETIDSFLRGDLRSAERTAFNEAVTADPKLQQEVSFQQEIINSVKQHRHQQLKDRLNAVSVKPVGVPFYSSPYLKLAASVGIVALIVGGYSLFTNKEDNTSVLVESSSTGTESTETQNTIASAENTNSNSTTQATVPTNQNKQADRKATATSTTVKTSKSTKSTNQSSESKKTTKGTPTFKEISEEPMDSDNTIEGINDNFNMPTVDNGGNTSNISSPQIKVSIVKENNLGYRFFNNQLFLHGNFSNSTYELFELNNKPSKQLFLYFENNYYELIQGKTKVTSLSPITDKAILIQLTQLREH